MSRRRKARRARIRAVRRRGRVSALGWWPVAAALLLALIVAAARLTQ